MASLIVQIVSWPTLGIALLLFGFAPGAVLRLIVLAFPRDDPRRRELSGELYAVPRMERPFWVIEHLEVGLFEGLPRRFARGRRQGRGEAQDHNAVIAFDAALAVQRAAQGDEQAWERLVDRYARLIWALTRDFKLSPSEAADVSQATWLRLLEHIDRLDHPERVGSWLAATARNECLRCLNARKNAALAGNGGTKGNVTRHPENGERLLASERAADVRRALSHLPWRWQRLLEMLMADPPATYGEISGRLGLPVGSIGPARGQCLEMLRGLLQTA